MIGRILYGFLFVVIVPDGLIGWARALDPGFPLPSVQAPLPGLILAAVGFTIMGTGIGQLVRRGNGLPMNAFPPATLVRSGPFRWIDHPIYLGFGLLVAGWSIHQGSAAGLWLVTPIAALAMTALVLGYERHDLRRRFGPAAAEPPRLALPPATDQPPRWPDRAAVFLRVLLPWVAIYFSVQALGRSPDAFVTTLPFERSWPVIQWTEALYASTYLFIPLTPLVLRARRELRAFAVRGAVATAVVTLCWLVIPVVADNRPFEPTGPMGRLLAFEQGNSRGVAAFPAFHVLWTLIAARGWLEGSPKLLRPFGWYGGVIGGVVGALTAKATGVAIVPLLAAFAIAAPWIQILGRLRCLVQGCCHGGPASEIVGIRYRHRRSRVTQLANLAGVPIHPTPLYSIAGNLVIGALLIRLRILGAPDPLLLGGYLMASGLARFVEESYRAEPQTKVLGGLAIASLLAGILCTLLPAEGRPGGFAAPTPALILAAAVMAAVTGFLMGVDFPWSSRRFSRLAPAD